MIRYENGRGLYISSKKNCDVCAGRTMCPTKHHDPSASGNSIQFEHPWDWEFLGLVATAKNFGQGRSTSEQEKTTGWWFYSLTQSSVFLI
jgi:hypothetical protein